MKLRRWATEFAIIVLFIGLGIAWLTGYKPVAGAALTIAFALLIVAIAEFIEETSRR